jgi:hypothetical protein
MPPDAAWPANGEPCGFDPVTGFYCAADFDCWLLFFTNVPICTNLCGSPAECGAYGPEACCAPPGPQTLDTTCIPGMYQECD